MKFVSRPQILAFAGVKISEIDMSSRHWLRIEAQRLLKGVTGGLAPIQFQICDPHKEMRIGIVRIGGNGFLEEFDRVGKFFLFQLAITQASQCRSVMSVDLQSTVKIRGGFLQLALRDVYIPALRERLIVVLIEFDSPIETLQCLEWLIVTFEL